jgi:hypothetical protein
MEEEDCKSINIQAPSTNHQTTKFQASNIPNLFLGGSRRFQPAMF